MKHYVFTYDPAGAEWRAAERETRREPYITIEAEGRSFWATLRWKNEALVVGWGMTPDGALTRLKEKVNGAQLVTRIGAWDFEITGPLFAAFEALR